MIPMFKPIITMRYYATPVSIESFKSLLKSEWEEGDNEQPLNLKIDDLEGVDNCDYNGHFGNFISYRIEAKHDTAFLHSQIIKLLYQYGLKPDEKVL